MFAMHTFYKVLLTILITINVTVLHATPLCENVFRFDPMLTRFTKINLDWLLNSPLPSRRDNVFTSILETIAARLWRMSVPKPEFNDRLLEIHNRLAKMQMAGKREVKDIELDSVRHAYNITRAGVDFRVERLKMDMELYSADGKYKKYPRDTIVILEDNLVVVAYEKEYWNF